MKDKVVIITGATSGIGKALAYKFSVQGSKVVLGARNVKVLKEICNDIKVVGGDATWLKTDVSIELDCRNLILTAINNFSKIDILINNAGISMRALFEHVDLEVIKKVMDINFWGTVYCTKYALPYILASKGSIAGVSSVAGIKGLPARTGYSASKFAMAGFLESLRNENLKNGLHVLMAYPGFTSSNIRNTALSADGTMQGESPREEEKMMSAEEVAKHIYNAVAKRKNKIILTSQGKLVATINKFFPNMLDNMVYNSLAKEPDSPFK
ncbi:MAG: SDR family oxidoreductase [Bacteroidetes bacterium]|nr:SDR family oxidoreductase [Bacteroidota bacterium]MBL6942891.1 SDR family oxidoreductase [Bacteroidales bacterium]